MESIHQCGRIIMYVETDLQNTSNKFYKLYLFAAICIQFVYETLCCIELCLDF